MTLSLIAAMDRKRVIGRDNALPWRLPEDLRYFRRMTTGHAVIMGRRNHESIGRPLPGRANIVITGQANYLAPGCTVVHDLDSAFKACAPGESEAFIIGGGHLYHETIAVADRIYLTLIPREIHGDTFFPEFSESDFEIIESGFFEGIEPYHFYIYERAPHTRRQGKP